MRSTPVVTTPFPIGLSAGSGPEPNFDGVRKDTADNGREDCDKVPGRSVCDGGCDQLVVGPFHPDSPAPASLAIDICARFFIGLLFLAGAVQFMTDFAATGKPTALAWLVTEALTAFLIATRRRATLVSNRIFDWFCAFAGSVFPMLMRPAGSIVPDIAAQILMILAIGSTLAARLSLGRSYGIVPSIRGLKTKGIYRHLRHPVYAASIFSCMAFLLTNFSPWNAFCVCGLTVFSIQRIQSEEDLLLRSSHFYRRYVKRVPTRLIPGLY